MKIIAIISLLFLFISFMPSQSQESKINVVVSISDFSSIVKEIGGNFVSVSSVLPAGSDPHSFSLTKETIDKIQNADLVILANSNLLSYEKKIKEDYNKEYLDFDDYVSNGASLDNFDGFNNNPHGYWLKIENAIAIAKTVALKLEEIYPSNADYFESSFISFKERAEKARQIALNEMKNKGLYGKKIVASVPGVCYIAENFGMESDAILLSEGTAYISGKELSELENKMKKGEYAGIIVPEFMKDAKPGEIARNIARDTDSKVIYVKFIMEENISYINAFYYNLLQFSSLSANEVKEKKAYNGDLVILSISLTILAAFEGAIIYELYRRT